MNKTIAFTLALAAISHIGMAANVVVENDSTYVESSLTAATISYHRVIYIPDRKREDVISWTSTLDKTEKLKSFSATFTDADGKVIKKLKKGELQMTELSHGLGDDNDTYYMNYTPASYPIKVTYDWTIENHNGVIAFPMLCPINGYDEEVRHATYTIKCMGDARCRYKAVNCEDLLSASNTSSQGQLTIQQQPDGTIKAIFNHLPAIKQESYSLPFLQRVPRIYFVPKHFSYYGTQGKLDTWQNFGLWQYDLLKGRDELPANTKAKVHELTDKQSSTKEKIAKLYQYLYDNTRYVSIQLGIGGYQPATASDVAVHGFGDCKGLSNYMVALLKEAGIPAFYAAISTEQADLLDNFPNLNQLNHVIAGVPMEKDTLWLECTNARYPLGYIHEDIAGHEALLITPEGGKIVRLPQYAATANTQKSKITINMPENGQADINISMEAANRQYEGLLPLLSMGAADQQKHLLASIHLPSAQVNTFKLEEEKGKPIVRTTLSATSKYANITGKRLFIKVNPLKADYSNIRKDESRQSDIYINLGYHDEEYILISIPDGYQVESMPENQEISNKFATLKTTFSRDGSSIHALYEITMKQGAYPFQDYDDFVKTKNAIAQACRQQIVIVKSE